MSETIDPILLLKDTVENKKRVKLNEKNELVFEDAGIKLPKDTKTAWARKEGEGHHSLGALWFLCANKDMKGLEYMKQAGDQGLLVNYYDRKEVIDYFTGAIQHSN